MKENNEYLAHYGVKGMKWGVRHDPERLNRIKKRASGTAKAVGKHSRTAASKVRANAKPVAKKVGRGAKIGAKYAFGPTRYAEGHRRIKQRRIDKSDYGQAKKMTNKELQDRINRINLEQNYMRAVAQDRASRRAAGQSVITKHGSTLVKETGNYTVGLVKNKEFKKRASKAAAMAVGL